MAEHNAKTKKEKILVDKEFLMKIANKVDEVSNRLSNFEEERKLDAEIKTLESKEPNMTQILPMKPKFEITVDFPESFTMQMVKEKGYQFHKQLERLISEYQITSIKITTN